MDIYSKIAQHIKGIAKDAAKIDTCLVCTVTSVSDTVCSATYDDFEFEDIRLHAVVDSSITILKPKLGTKILVGSIDGSIENLYVLKAQDYDLVKYQVENSVVQIDSQGILIQRGDENLRKLLLDIVSLLKSLKVATPTGPSSKLITPTPIQLIDIETRIKSLLKDE